MIIRNLWRRKVRSGLTVAGIAVGIGVVVTLIVVSEGMSGQLTAMISAGGAEITVLQSGIADMQFSVLDAGGAETIEAMPEVLWASGTLIEIVPALDRPYFVLLGVDPQSPAFEHFRLVAGLPLAAENEILLGRISAEFSHAGPGDTLEVQGHTLRVAGIYETGVGYEDAGGVMALEAVQRLFRKEGRVNLIRVKIRPGSQDQIEQIAQAIEGRLPGSAAFRSADFSRNIPDIQTLDTLAGAVSLIGVIAGGLGTMNTMLMSVFERTREIGTLRALGWRRRRVMGMVLGESLVLSLIGGLAGIALGMGLVALIRVSPALPGMIPLHLAPQTIAVALGVALALGAVGGIYPAWRAARLTPVEALRYE